MGQMILTKKQFCKDDGYIAWHGYQSFKPGEVTPEECHAIGVQTARELWGKHFQIIVTTHLDREHLHNHFCFNSVGFRDGRKYNYSKAERRRFMDVSDRICAEHGLTVIRNPKKSPSRPVWLDEQAGKPTRYNIYRQDFLDGARGSWTVPQLEAYLTRLGYEVDFTGPKWKMKLPHQYRRAFHPHRYHDDPSVRKRNGSQNQDPNPNRKEPQPMSNKILAEYLPVDKLRPFEGHPFQVKDNEEMNQLVWSIITQAWSDRWAQVNMK